MTSPPENARPYIIVTNRWLAAFLATKGFVEAEQPAVLNDRIEGTTRATYCFHHTGDKSAGVILRAWDAAQQAVIEEKPNLFDAHLETVAENMRPLANQVADYYACLVNSQRIAKNTRSMIKVPHPRAKFAVISANYGPQKARELNLPYPPTNESKTPVAV